MEEGGPYIINATSGECTLTLENILFGDVWICSGQSNMQQRLDFVIPTFALYLLPQIMIKYCINYISLLHIFINIDATVTISKQLEENC